MSFGRPKRGQRGSFRLEEERCRQESCKASVDDEEIENREELQTVSTEGW